MCSSFKPDLGKFKLRTVRLRKQLSQGLALPVGLFPEAAGLPIGSDLTALLGVEQYEPPIPVFIAGDTRTFRWPIPKTDEIRVQQDDEHSFLTALAGKPYFISLKLDGTSCTFIIDPRDGEFHACGRNYSYKQTPDHAPRKSEGLLPRSLPRRQGVAAAGRHRRAEPLRLDQLQGHQRRISARRVNPRTTSIGQSAPVHLAPESKASFAMRRPGDDRARVASSAGLTHRLLFAAGAAPTVAACSTTVHVIL